MNIKNKILITLLISLFIAWIAFWIYNMKNNLDNKNKSNTWSLFSTDTWWIDENDYSFKWDKKNQISELKKKLALKWLIVKWDLSLEKWDYTNALLKYIQINKEIPNDKSIVQKIWDVYFEMKKFDKAYQYYSKIKDYDKLDKNKVVKTLFSSVSLNTKHMIFIRNELKTLWLNEQQLYYYNTSLECRVDFSKCRKDFQDYFDNRNNQKNVNWTWAVIKQEYFEDLEKIWNAIENYKNFQVDDLNYKWALIAWAFFENWLYPIAIETSKSILKSKSDYKPMIKIIAKSYYELWNYIQAKLYLIEYTNLVKDDSEINFFLWVIYEKLNEYVLSTIHLNNAIDNWYEDKLDVYKRIVYNYYELWDMNKIVNTFNLMIKNCKDKLTENDYSLAIYYNLVNDKNKIAKDITSEALIKYPESELINGYMWWLLMDEANKKPIPPKNSTASWTTVEENNKQYLMNLYSEADRYIEKWLKKDYNSPMLNLVKWKLEYSRGDKNKAIIYFKKTVSIDWNWEFWKMAKQEMKNIDMNK